LENTSGDKGPSGSVFFGCLGVSLGIVGLLTALAVVSAIVSAFFPDDSGLDEGALVVACQNAVKNNLKAPSTADFVGVPKAEGMYITGQVDAENAFGAMLRASFRCTIIDEKTVRLDYLD
jgi:hypothetical protein